MRRPEHCSADCTRPSTPPTRSATAVRQRRQSCGPACGHQRFSRPARCRPQGRIGPTRSPSCAPPSPSEHVYGWRSSPARSGTGWTPLGRGVGNSSKGARQPAPGLGGPAGGQQGLLLLRRPPRRRARSRRTRPGREPANQRGQAPPRRRGALMPRPAPLGRPLGDEPARVHLQRLQRSRAPLGCLRARSEGPRPVLAGPDRAAARPADRGDLRGRMLSSGSARTATRWPGSTSWRRGSTARRRSVFGGPVETSQAAGTSSIQAPRIATPPPSSLHAIWNRKFTKSWSPRATGSGRA